ncbi:MAG: hypothetical protein WA207_13025, partial [Candidatus Acidiferrum sp.]
LRALGRGNQEWPVAGLCYQGSSLRVSLFDASAFFAVGPLEQEIEKEVASENAERKKQRTRHDQLTSPAQFVRSAMALPRRSQIDGDDAIKS